MIGEDQKRAFYEDGFLILEDFLSLDEVEECGAACDELDRYVANWEFSKEDFNLEAPGGGFQGQDGKLRSYAGVIRAVHHVERHSPWFSGLPGRKRLQEDVIQPLMNTQSAHYLSGILWNKPARVGSGQPWHQDFGYVDEDTLRQLRDAMTIWIAIDPATRENGCLQFLPGSHRRGLAPHQGERSGKSGAKQLRLDIDEHFADFERRAVELRPGSAVCFTALVAHGSAANTSDRSRRAISYGYSVPAGEG